MTRKWMVLFFVLALAVAVFAAPACSLSDDDDDDDDDTADDDDDDDDFGDDDDDDDDISQEEACEYIMDALYNQCGGEFPDMSYEEAVTACAEELDVDTVGCMFSCIQDGIACEDYVACLNGCLG